MQERISKLENQVDSLQGYAVEHKTVITSLDNSMKSIAHTMEDMGKVMSANEVREEANRIFKIDIMDKLNLASERREIDRDMHRKFNNSIDKRVALMEQANYGRDDCINELKAAKTAGLSSWKATGLTVIVSTIMVIIATTIKSHV